MINIGNRVVFGDGYEGTVVETGDSPIDSIKVEIEGGVIVSVCPETMGVEVIDSKSNKKEEIKMMKTEEKKVLVRKTEYVPPVITTPNTDDRMLPDINEGELLVVSNIYKQKLPSGLIVDVQFRKLTNTMGVLAITDDLGTRHFKVMGSKRDAGELFVPSSITQSYERKDGSKAESPVIEMDKRATAIVAAIATRVMAAEGISFEDQSNMLPELGSDIPFA